MNLQMFNELFHILERLIVLHRNLLEALREEFSHMSSLDIKGLLEAAQTKEVLLSEIIKFEKLREVTVKKISIELKIDLQETSLQKIVKFLPKEKATEFLNCRQVLQMLLTQAKEWNVRNMAFAESSLNKIEEMKKNILGMSNNNPSENYSQDGVRQQLQSQGGRLLSTEA